jgi:hypothetical protein
MSAPGIHALLERYRSALETKLTRLMRLQSIASRQLATIQAGDITALRRESNERDTMTLELALLDQQIRSSHDRLSREPAVQRLPGFTHALKLHKTLSTMLDEILATDRIAIGALEAIVAERRTALQSAEKAANTLSAYARMAARPANASLVNGRG